MEYKMLGLRFVQQFVQHLSFVRHHRRTRIHVRVRLHTLILLGGAALFAAGVVLPLSAFAQRTPDPIAEIIRTQLEARKPPPEPVLLPTPEVTEAPPVDANADPANDAVGERQEGITQVPPVVAAPPVKPPKFIPPKLYVGKELLRAATLLTRFYEGRAYQPAWTTTVGPLPFADELLTTIQEEAGREALHTSDYHLAKVKAVLADIRLNQASQKAVTPALLADLDFLLTDTFLTYGVDASLGEVNLEALNEKWFSRHDETDLVPLLQTAISSTRIADAIRSLPPKQAEYTRLREVLARYRDIVAHGGWPTVPAGPALALGSSGERVAKLRARLIASGDLRTSSSFTGSSDTLFDVSEKRDQQTTSEVTFDQELEQAVQNFQHRHGLHVNGTVGGETLAALNMSAETRVRQIAMNMMRWRNLPQDMGQRYIAVNVPNFTLEVVENDQPVMDMKVVVGKMVEERATPTFSAKMTYLVLNPYWYVPKNIAEKELWPMHLRNPQYFARNNFDIRRIPAGYKQIVDPTAIDGAKKSVRVYDYVIRQGPGPKNALGRVKFMFPNPYSIYLHDTPSKELFNRTVRAFSHGCIRIEKPLDLAEYVLRDSPKWPKNAIQATLHRDKEQTVYLPDPLPVYIQYWTVWVDNDGTVQFRNDIYHYDHLIPGSHLPKGPRTPRVLHPLQPKVRKRVPQVQPPAPQPVLAPEQAAAGQ